MIYKNIIALFSTIYKSRHRPGYAPLPRVGVLPLQRGSEGGGINAL